MTDTLDISGFLIPADVLDEELQKNGYRLIRESSLALLTIDGYIKRYYEYTAINTTYAIAWQKVEEEFFRTFGMHRFMSWDSFRNSAAVKSKMKK